jgi:DNA-binding transcriptional ArsR family regulator
MRVTTSQIRSDTDLAVTLRIAVSRLARRIRAERAAKGLPELSDTQFAALAALARQAGMTPGELAAHEKVQPPSMTRVIAVLEERGLLARAPHPTDKRQAGNRPPGWARQRGCWQPAGRSARSATAITGCSRLAR